MSSTYQIPDSDSDLPIDVILVPQGQELAAVQAGCRASGFPLESVQALPVGPAPVRQFFQTWQSNGPAHRPLRVVTMGLCGALTLDGAVGDVVLYESCLDATTPGLAPPSPKLLGDAALNGQILKKLAPLAQPIALVRAVTTAEVVCLAQAKADLAAQTQAQVVDMEGSVLWQELQQRGMTVATVRVISDGARHDLPNLSAAFSKAGDLLPLPLAQAMLSNPLAALRLIRGSLMGLKVLEQVARGLTQT